MFLLPAVERRRLRVDQDQTMQSLGPHPSELEGHEPAHRHTPEDAFLDPPFVEDLSAIVREVAQVVRLGPAIRPRPMVVGDDPIPILQRLDLRREHRMVHERAVREDDRGPLPTVDDGSIDRHGPSS
jgi:hypothetical protein